jgi:5-methylcytosine-specific restriction endonuclease McrA
MDPQYTRGRNNRAVPLDATERRCSKCGETKSLAEFRKNKSAPTGTGSTCKLCHAAHNREYNKTYPYTNPSQTPEYKRAYYETHKDMYRAISARRDALDPEGRLERTRRRRARIKGAITTLTIAEWKDILAYFGNACAYCLRDDVPMTMDHIVPISKGGAHSAENVVPACMACNQAKHVKSLLVWALTDLSAPKPQARATLF